MASESELSTTIVPGHGARTREGRPGIGPMWIVRRLGFGLVILWFVATLVFIATQLLPGDAARAVVGRGSPTELAAIRHQLGLDQPVIEQYGHWLRNLVQGNLGLSLATRNPVGAIIGPALRNSLILLGLAAGIALPLGVVLGFRAAARHNKILDHSLMGMSLVFTALPEFVVGLVLVMVFSTNVFALLPAVANPTGNPLAQPTQLVLPVITLVLASVPYIFRLARAAMIEVLASDYIAMARLKGLGERRVMWHHAAPNALVPPIQASAIILVYLLSGVVVVEYVFSYPGLGSALITSVSARDVPTIQAIVLVFAAGIVLFNLAADALTILATPRLRTAQV
jgi:peptide/nickel transport system permease protein